MIKLFGGRVTVGKELSQYSGRTDDYYAVLEQKYGTDYALRNKLTAYKNIVYACVSLIGEACGEYEPFVQRRVGDHWETIDHEFIQLLKHPGGVDNLADSFSQFDLFEATSSYQSLQGDCFWYMGRGAITAKPREIIILRPDKVGTDINPKSGKVNGYFIRQSFGDPIPLEVEEVLRFNLFNPLDPYKGYGTVAAGSDYIATDESTAAFTKNFFVNNAGLSGVLNIKGEVTKGAFRKFVRAWRDKYEGVDNAGKVAILRDSDAAFTKVGLGLNEMDMASLRSMTLDDVLMMFKVPLPLLGKADQTGLGRGNVEALEYIFAKYNIDKKMQRFDSVLGFALNRYYPNDKDLRITHTSIVPEDKEFKLKELEMLVDKTITRNEARDFGGLDPVDGGDQLFVPAMSVPLNDTASDITNSKTAKIKVKLIKKEVIIPKPIYKADNKQQFATQLMRNQTKYEKQFRRKVKPIFIAQRKEALTNLEAHAGGDKKEFNALKRLVKAGEQKLFNDAAYDAQLLSALKPMMTDLAKTQGGIALVFAGDTENEFHLTSNLINFIQKNTLRMATGFNDETLTRLNETLAEGIQNGEGLGDLKKRVSSVYDGVDGYRAERIARTETIKASNNASVWAYKQTGYVTGKEWVVNPGACEQCQEFENMTIPLDQAFLELGGSYTVTGEDGEGITYTNDYDTVEDPPLHPNCRCTVAPVSGTFSLSSESKVLPANEELAHKAQQAGRVDLEYLKELERFAAESGVFESE